VSFLVVQKKPPHGGFFSSRHKGVSVYLIAGVLAAAAGAASFLDALCATLCFFTLSAAGLAAGVAAVVVALAAGAAVVAVTAGAAAVAGAAAGVAA